MLDRSQVAIGKKYEIKGEDWWVWMIHKPGSGEAVTVTKADPATDGFYKLLHGGCGRRYMQMRKFQRDAALPNVKQTRARRRARRARNEN